MVEGWQTLSLTLLAPVGQSCGAGAIESPASFAPSKLHSEVQNQPCAQALRIDYENACRDHGLSADDATQDWGADF